MENRYNFILGLFIGIVILSASCIYYAYSQYLPDFKKNQISTHIYSPFNHRGDSIYKSPSSIVLEAFFSNPVHP